MNLIWLKTLRQYELDAALSLVRLDISGLSVLEVGAGMGYQAKQMQSLGANVRAIDIKTSNYKNAQVFPVEDYDGSHIPYEDESFDIIFTSNVLEHIPHIDRFMKTEMRRVLKRDGIAIHVVPSASWRFWTNFTHYLDIPARVLRFIAKRFNHTQDLSSDNTEEQITQRSVGEKILSFLFPARHGERGNTLTEFYYFSRFGWNALFGRNGWYIVKRIPSGVFYTGHGIGGVALSIHMRCKLSRFLGSSTHIYVLKKCVE